MRIERWQNADTGVWYEVEYADATDAPQANAEGSQLPDSTPDPTEPSEAVLGRPAMPAPYQPPDPRRVRLLARLMRSILEDPNHD